MNITGQAVSHGVMKRNNLALVLSIVAQLGEASRADIIERSGLTQPAITRIVSELLEAGLLEEALATTTVAKRGRPATSLRLAQGRVYSIGVDTRLDRTTIIARCFAGVISHEEWHPGFADPTPEEFFGFIAERVRDIASRMDSRLAGVGIALPARFNDDRTRVENSPLWSWTDVDVLGEMTKRLDLEGVPVLFDHIWNAAAIANSRFLPVTKGARLAHVQVGYTVGIGLTHNGSRFSRFGCAATDFSHLPIQVEPWLPCPECRAPACLESRIGVRAIESRAREIGISMAGDPHAISRFCHELAEVAQGDDERARRALDIIKDAAQWSAQAAFMVATATGATAVTVGGYPEYLGDIFFEHFMAHVEDVMPHLLPLMRRFDHPAMSVDLDDRAAIIGAAVLGLEQMRTDPTVVMSGSVR
ncbi:ROK family protein [Micrococcales bacterium 31B]|nr:ROK family protein [Micrococcales bacterium 31B]